MGFYIQIPRLRCFEGSNNKIYHSAPEVRALKDRSKVVRKFVFDHFLRRAQPPTTEAIMRKFGLIRKESFDLLLELQAAKHLLLLPGTQRILMAFPFSSIATPFKVRVGKREYFANCAWDAVAFHVMLKRDTLIESYCHHCAEEIRIRLRGQKVASAVPRSPLVYIALPAARWWDNILNTCSNNMTFFSSVTHFQEWKLDNLENSGEKLTIEQALRLSVPIYSDKMKIEYTRPSREQFVSYFESMGLVGDFWKI